MNEKTYNEPFEVVYDMCIEVFKSLPFSIKDSKKDGKYAEITGKNGLETIKIKLYFNVKDNDKKTRVNVSSQTGKKYNEDLIFKSLTSKVTEKARYFKERQNKRICPSCGKINSLKAEFCINCGKKMNKIILPFAEIYSENKKEKINNEIDDDSNQIDNTSTLPFATIKMEPNKLSRTIKVLNNKKIGKDSDKILISSYAGTNIESFRHSIGSNNKKIQTGLNNPSTKEDPTNTKIIVDETNLKKSLSKKDVTENNSSETLIPISPLDEIKKANKLLEIGAITKDEFQIIKTKYIEKI